MIEALQSGRAIDKIFMFKHITGENVQEIKQLARTNNVPVQMVPVEKLNGFTKANHQGIVAIAALISYSRLQQLLILL